MPMKMLTIPFTKAQRPRTRGAEDGEGQERLQVGDQLPAEGNEEKHRGEKRQLQPGERPPGEDRTQDQRRDHTVHAGAQKFRSGIHQASRYFWRRDSSADLACSAC